MFKDLMGNVFPADWMVMNLVQMQVFLRAIGQYSDVLNTYFLDQTHFELQVRPVPRAPSRRSRTVVKPREPHPCSCGAATSG